MIELFRYIEHAFASASVEEESINVATRSDLQQTLSDLHNDPNAGERMKTVAENFLKQHFPAAGPFPIKNATEYLSVYNQVKASSELNTKKAVSLVENIFDTSLRKILDSNNFSGDKTMLDDSIVAFKLFFEFDGVDITDLVRMRQAIAFIETLSKTDELIDAKKLLLRTILVPSSLLPAKKPITHDDQPPGENPEVQKFQDVQKEIHTLELGRSRLMSLQSQEMDLHPVATIKRALPGYIREHDALAEAPISLFSKLTISRQAFESTNLEIKKTFQNLAIQAGETDIPIAINTIERRITELSANIESFLYPQPARLYRLGTNVFAVPPSEYSMVKAEILPDFSKAVIKPLGIGNLQVVKQELIKYEAGEISHIENILEGEKYRRETERAESSETIITQETETIKTEERDLQSTERNEMVSETQKEISKQTSSVKDQTTTVDYGKLVENNKSNYARTVTDRAVNILTQRVRETRVQIEKKSYVEKTFHEFDNSTGDRKVRGIYQWVDKKYKTRILNYGKRLLYDVTIPEPAAFLIDSLKKVQQPENFNIVKPEQPSILAKQTSGGLGLVTSISGYDYRPLKPQDLSNTNYMGLAAQYGVAGSVEPPPTTFSTIKAWTSFSQGNMIFSATNITIPAGYKAIAGFFQTTNWRDENGNVFQNNEGAEVYIGEKHHFLMTAVNESFKMNGETGEIPITFCAGGMKGYNLAVGIICQNDTALAKWQLKTFAAIMEGYRKQFAEYEDKLNKLQTIIRSQMASSKNYAHNPTIEREELKKAFIFLILSAQYGKFIPTPDPLKIPPDPIYNNKWGAMVSFFERAFEWENMMYVYYPYFWGQRTKWAELILIQDINPQFEEFLKAGAARVVVPVRPGFEAPMAHFQETGEVWMGKEMPNMFSEQYISIINEINARNFEPGKEKCIAEWELNLPTSLVMLKSDEVLPVWSPSAPCIPEV